jgi:glycosyltransferase involved in cell wall biosynthesis
VKISVIIPTYNSAAVIRQTLDSVLRQTVQPDEILVLDDGSADETVSILNSYRPKVSVLQQQNRGVAATRNELCKRATGDLVAFLDHDDLWHPRYLEVQSRKFSKHPKATAFFTRHENFNGYGDHQWSTEPADSDAESQVISPANFIERYNSSTGTFYSMSFCCIPKWVLTRLGDAPFCEAVSGVDDCYLCNLLPLHGPVVLTPLTLVAYRVTPQAQSSNQLKSFRNVVQVFESLEKNYRAAADAKLLPAFRLAFAGKRRRYGKTLMGAGMLSEARNQFRRSVSQSPNPASMAKSISLLCLSYLPALLQPRWPSSARRSAA